MTKKYLLVWTLLLALYACTSPASKEDGFSVSSAGSSSASEKSTENRSSASDHQLSSSIASERTDEDGLISDPLSSPEQLTPFTAETAFEFLKTTEKYNKDMIVTLSEYQAEENYYYLVLADPSLRKNGESGTIGSYHVYENGTIIDTYPDKPFTVSAAFEILKEAQGFNEDILVETSTYDPDKKYQELIVASKELKKNGGSGTVGIYQVYEDGTIVDTYLTDQAE